MKIAVYLSSHDDLAPEYAAAAETLGSWMGSNGHTLVYGGARRPSAAAAAASTAWYRSYSSTAGS